MSLGADQARATMVGTGEEGWPRAIVADLAFLRTMLVNVCFVGLLGAGDSV